MIGDEVAAPTPAGSAEPAVERLQALGVEWATRARGGGLYTPRGLAWFGRADPAEPEGYTVPDLAAAVRLFTETAIAWVPADEAL